MKEGILIVDVGTSKVHINLIDIYNGALICATASPYSWIHPKEGWSEVDPNEIWNAAEKAVDEVLLLSANTCDIKAIAFSYIGDSLLLVDKNLNPLHNLILAFDARAKIEAQEIIRDFSEDKFMQITGSNLIPEFVPSKLLWLKKNQPALFQKAAYFWNIQQFFNHRLGLPDVTDFTLASRKIMIDIKKNDWSIDLCRYLEINPETLGTQISPADSIIGEINNFGKVNFKRSIPVMLGAHDSECGMIGLGCIPGSDAVIGNITGTYDHIGYLTKAYIETRQGFSTSYSGPLKDSYVFMGASIAGPSVDWFVKTFYPNEGSAVINRLFNETQFDGKNKLLLTQGIQTGDGRLQGINFNTDLQDIFKAIVEGITFPLKGTMELMLKVNGKRFGSMRVGGGGAKSDGWLQLKANMFNLKVERVENIEISSIGAAIMATVVLGYHHKLEDAMNNMIAVESTFQPSEEIVKNYNERFEEFLNNR